MQVVNCETSVSGSQWQFAVPLSPVHHSQHMGLASTPLPANIAATIPDGPTTRVFTHITGRGVHHSAVTFLFL